MLTLGESYRFTGAQVSCSGIRCGACNEVVDDLVFESGRFVRRLSPGEEYRPGKGRWKSSVLRGGPNGTNVFVGTSANKEPGVSFHFGLDDCTDGARIEPEQS